MTKRLRTERREAARDLAKLAQTRAKLAALERGGAADRPIEVASASIAEPHAANLECAACGAHAQRVDEHVAVTVSPDGREPARRLRVVRLRCSRCGTRRDVFFRVGTVLPS